MEIEWTETRWSHLLRPLRELSENWSVDIAGELERFLEKLELLPDEAQLRFADAAVLVQQSADVYGRKVEHLYQLVYHALETLLLKHGQVPGAHGGRSGKRCAESGKVSDEDTEAFAAATSARGLNPASGAVRGALTMTAYRKYLQAERAFQDIAELVPFAKTETLDLEELEGSSVHDTKLDEELRGNHPDEKSARSMVASAERHTMTVATPGTPGWRAPVRKDAASPGWISSASIAAAPWHMPCVKSDFVEAGLFDADQLWLRWSQIHGRTGALLLGVASEELLFEKSAQVDSDSRRANVKDGSTSPSVMDCCAPDDPWGFGAPVENFSPNLRPQTLAGPDADSITQQKRRRHRKPPELPADPWKQLDMFPASANPATTGEAGLVDQGRPFRKGRTFVLRSAGPRTGAFDDFQKWLYLRKLVPGVPLEHLELANYPGKTRWSVRRGDPEWVRAWMHIIFRGSILPALDASIRAKKRSDRHRGYRRKRATEQRVSDEDAQSSSADDDSSFQEDSQDIPDAMQNPLKSQTDPVVSNFSEGRDLGFEAGDSNEALPEIGGLDIFDGPGAFQIEDPEPLDADPEVLVETFEQVCKRYLEETARAWRRVQEERALYQRVEGWHTTLRPQLLAAEQRAVFSIPTYVQKVGDRLSTYQQSTKTIPPGIVCADRDRTEICRLFVALLHLAAETGLHIDTATSGPVALQSFAGAT
jgi:hypothetical protein